MLLHHHMNHVHYTSYHAVALQAGESSHVHDPYPNGHIFFLVNYIGFALKYALK